MKLSQQSFDRDLKNEVYSYSEDYFFRLTLDIPIFINAISDLTHHNFYEKFSNSLLILKKKTRIEMKEG